MKKAISKGRDDMKNKQIAMTNCNEKYSKKTGN